MAMSADFIWKNGELVRWEDATVHVLSHALHYGTSVFEGLRAYEIGEDACVLCGPEHFERMIFSCKVAYAPSPYTVEQWMDATADTLQANRHRSAYLRPLVFRGHGPSLALDGREGPIDAILASVPWGAYYSAEAQEQGIDIQVGSWRRTGSGATAAMAKIGGQYVNSQFNLMQAHDSGFAEAVALDTQGFVSEGSGQNIFIVHDGVLITPTIANSILGGITRYCIMTIARDLGIEVREQNIPREMLYLADEVFFSGTAVEICPVRSVDRIVVGEGSIGPVTKALKDEFFGILHGTRPDKRSWLTPVHVSMPAEERQTA
ncbi:MAG: branched-chain amino acid transaminase [Rhodobacter sp.]|nr:branched-chain amino acid transaminase [Rhodobacter sp.]